MNDRFTRIDEASLAYVNEGQHVAVLRSEGWIRCRVVCACGDAARVVNESREIDAWVYLRHMRRWVS